MRDGRNYLLEAFNEKKRKFMQKTKGIKIDLCVWTNQIK